MYNDDYFFFRNKTVIISGSSKGIGRTLARELGMMGANVIINGTDGKVLEETAATLKRYGIEVLAVQGNVACINDCKKIVDAAIDMYGSINFLFANAGISSMGSVEETSPEVFEKIMKVNYLGVVYLVKACIPALKLSRGSIMITGSASGIRGIPGASAYSASKMALTAFADCLRIELSRDGVHVSIAYVGFTENDSTKLMLNDQGEIMKKQKVARGKVASQVDVATRMIEMVQRRQYSRVFSLMGNLNNIFNRFAPWLSHLILKRYYNHSNNA